VGDPSFFTDRGIPKGIWQSRPYVLWTPEDPSPATAHFADLSAPQRAFVTKLVNQSAGWVIVRHPPPMFPPLARIYPELRPLDPVKTQGPTTHWHGDGPAPEDLPDWARMPGTRKNWQKHIDRGKKKVKGPDDHRGANVETLHRHQHVAKYVFGTSAKIDKWYEHDHDTSWKTTSAAVRPAKRAAHIAKRGELCHAGIDQMGLHRHKERVKDPNGDNMAKRIDVHPMAVKRILDTEVVFFVIEGCIKADAVLADGGAVFSVPSVSLWDCDELRIFAASYLLDKTVVIVPDADWSLNPTVQNQATMCRTQLYRLGVPDVHVAAPPSPYNGLDTKGVDDLIGAHGHLEDLIVIDSDPPQPELHEFVSDRAKRRDQSRRDEGVLWALSTFTGSEGVLKAPLKTVARVMGTYPMAVSRGVHSLERMGALTIDGDLALKRDWPFSRRWEWRERPTITLIPELRSPDGPEQRLGDLVQLSLRTEGVTNAAG
jgi:hypothetical protein